MRIHLMITKGRMLSSFIKFSQLILQGKIWRSVGSICMWILVLKGLILNYEGKLADVQTGPKTKRKMLAFILMKKEQPIISALGQFFQNTCST